MPRKPPPVSPLKQADPSPRPSDRTVAPLLPSYDPASGKHIMAHLLKIGQQDIFWAWQIAALSMRKGQISDKSFTRAEWKAVKESQSVEPLLFGFNVDKDDHEKERHAISTAHAIDMKKVFLLQAAFDVSDGTITIRPLQRKHGSRFSRKFGDGMALVISLKKDKSKKGQKKGEDIYRKELDWTEFGLGRWEFLFAKITSKQATFIRTDRPNKDGIWLTAEKVRNWLVDTQCNSEQTLSKYQSRISLAFSSSFCVEKVLAIDQYGIIPDIDHFPEDGNEDSIMTDGCGLIAASLMKTVADQLGLTCIPSAIQARFGCCKGVSFLFLCFLFVNSPPSRCGSWQMTIQCKESFSYLENRKRNSLFPRRSQRSVTES